MQLSAESCLRSTMEHGFPVAQVGMKLLVAKILPVSQRVSLCISAKASLNGARRTKANDARHARLSHSHSCGTNSPCEARSA